MSLVHHPHPQYAHAGFKYDRDRTVLSDCGEYAALWTAPQYVKRPKILRIRIVHARDYNELAGYVTFCNQKHHVHFSPYHSKGFNPGRVKNLTETGPELAHRLFAIAKAFKS